MPIRFDITSRTPIAGGQPFGDTGPYERLIGRAYLAIDPLAAENQIAFDITNAERGADGLVHVTTDLWVMRPTDPSGGARRLLFDLLNRGNKRSIQFFNDGAISNDPVAAGELGHGFLQRHGFSLAACAWQGDVLPGDGRMTIDLPLIRPGGQIVTAPVRAEFIVDRPGITSLPLSGKNGTHSYASTSLDPTSASLVRRRYPGTPAQTIPTSRWRFATVQGNATLAGRGGDVHRGQSKASSPSPRHIYLPEGFACGWIYELTYTAQDPLALDLGFLAVRDVAAFLRSNAEDNPLRGQIDHAYCWGRSQSGRAIRDYLHRGFNAGADGKRVFDGMLPHISGGGKTAMNRFSNLVVAASRQYEDQLNPSDRFPFSYAESRDHLTGKTGAILTRPDTDPLVIHTHTASEYWNRRGSLVHTDTEGRDLAQPENVRIYAWTSSQHWADPLLKGPTRGPHLNDQNVVATSAFFRAILLILDAWVSHGTAPPNSRVPLRADGTLLTSAEWRARFPAIPGIALPRSPNELHLVEYGPGFDAGDAIEEPAIVHLDRSYAVLVPAVDDTGNDRAGLLAPMVQAPLATYTGWNIRVRGHGAGMLHDFSGSTIPLPDTAEERAMTGDPRRSIAERYGDAAGYVAAIRQAAQSLATDRFYLPEDVERAASAAARWHAPRHTVGLPD